MEDIIDIIVTETTNTIEITSQASDELIDVNIIDNREDIVLNVTPTVVEININSLTGNFGVEWGDITGTLADQTDLNTALGLKADLVGGKVPSSQLPSYVDDIVEVANYAALPATGETGKIYVVLDTNKIYRWSGSAYIEIADSTAVWGAITGTLSSQTDLQNALNAKFDDPTGDTTQYIAGDGSLVTFPIAGQAGTLVREVRNTTGATLTKGTVVYISGATGNKPTVSKALATGDSTSAQTFGLCQANIANNSNGYVVCVGDIVGLDTSAISEGVQLYLSSTTAGTYTTTKQLAPAHLVYIGVVTRSHPTQGQIEVKIQNGYELDEIHDVLITSKANNDGLFYESSTSLWKNKSIATVLGYTPANAATYVPYTGATSDVILGVNKLKATSVYAEGSGGGGGALQIKQYASASINEAGYSSIGTLTSGIFYFASATTAPNFKNFALNPSGLTDNTLRTYALPDASGTIALTSDLHNAVTLGTANGLSLSTQVLSLGLASGSTNGALSSTDWTTFNGKQNALSGTGFVKSTAGTISYDTSTYALDSSVVHNTGAETISGIKYFFSGSKHDLLFVSETVGYASIAGYSHFKANTNHVEFINSTNTKSTKFIHGNAAYEFTMPNASGTIALTSNLSSYLPLSGGTLTGALSGTSATFTTASTVPLTVETTSGNSGIIIKTSSTTYNWLLGAQYNVGNGFEITPSTSVGGSTFTTPIFKITNSGAATFSSSVTAGSTSSGAQVNVYASSYGSNGLFNAYGTDGNLKLQMGGLGTNEGFIYTGPSNKLSIYTGGSTSMTITSAGNVGIGTTSPNHLLSLSATASNKTEIGLYNTFNDAGNRNWAIATNQVAYGDFHIMQSNAKDGNPTSSGTSRLIITSGGNVLINKTNNTGDKLQVSDGTNMYNFSFDANGQYLSSVNNANTVYKRLSFDANDVVFYGSGTQRIRITNAGVFDFNGDSTETSVNDKFAQGFSNGNYAWLQSFGGKPIYLNRVGNAVYAGTQRIDNNSDARIKSNIQNIKNALETVLSLSGKKFNMLDENNILRYGFIAQEVQPHLNDFVTESNRNFEKGDIKIENLLTLENSGSAWGALLVEAIKELKAELDTLKNK
jgi:hypothetical protein